MGCSSCGSGAEQSLAASARTFGGGGRSQGDSGQSLEEEKRSYQRWAVTQSDAADVQRSPTVTQRYAAALRPREATSPPETKRPPVTQPLPVYGCRGSRGNEGIMFRSSCGSGAEQSLAASARTFGGGGRSLGGSGQSLEAEKRSQRRWAVTQRDAADVQRSPADARAQETALQPEAPTSPREPQDLHVPTPFWSTAAGAAAETRVSRSALVVDLLRSGHSRRRLGRSAVVGGH
ncbi:hypothetical protein ALCH109712_12665 [Alkalicoccus chagannorensis]